MWTDAECYSNPPGKYAAEKMIDGDLGTYACLLDDTRTGKDPTVCPPKAAPPVTATFVLDLGSERTVSGMRFVARNAWVYVLAKNVSIFACADAQGREQIRPLAENQELPATSNSNSAFVEWPPVHDALPEGARQRFVPAALSRAVDVRVADSLVPQGGTSDGGRREEPEHPDRGNHLL